MIFESGFIFLCKTFESVVKECVEKLGKAKTHEERQRIAKAYRERSKMASPLFRYSVIPLFRYSMMPMKTLTGS